MSGFDWNGNGYEDAGDWYMDYEIMNDKGSGGSGGNGNNDNDGCGCLLLIIIVLIVLSLF